MASIVWETIKNMLYGGLLALADYLSLHVLLCLVPAFFIAGAMVIFIPKNMIMKYIGKDSKRVIAYPVAAIAGLLLAVCSCTVLPLFAGIKKKGAGLGPAITFLFSAPAVNILALTYTGVLIGMDIAIARAILALIFAIIIGYLMELIFKEKPVVEKEQENTEIKEKLPEDKINLDFSISNLTEIVLGILLVINGILIAFLNKELLIRWGVENPYILQTVIWGAGIVILIGCMAFIKNTTINLFLGLIYILFTGTSQISYFNVPTDINIAVEWVHPMALANYGIKTLLTLIVGGIVAVYAIKNKKEEDNKMWMEETWDFAKKIFPYIIIGVFVAGMLQILIPTEFIQNLVGENTVVANAIGVSFGVIAYFPTLMEVPIAKMFLELGMSRGVLLAYLLADPELSIQSILVTRKFLGDKKNLVYILLVTIFTIIAGLLFGLIVSGEPIKFI